MKSPDDVVVLTDEQIREIMTPQESLGVLERTFRDLSAGKGVTRPRSRTYVSAPQPGAVYQFVCIAGGSSEVGYFGLRLLSLLRHYPGAHGAQRAATVGEEGKQRGMNFASDEVGTTPEMEADVEADWEKYPDLADLIAGKASDRTTPE